MHEEVWGFLTSFDESRDAYSFKLTLGFGEAAAPFRACMTSGFCGIPITSFTADLFAAARTFRVGGWGTRHSLGLGLS